MSQFSSALVSQLIDPQQAVIEALSDAHSGTYGEVIDGPVNKGTQLSFPAVHLVARNATEQSGGEYQVSFFLNIYLEQRKRTGHLALIDEHLERVWDTTEATLAATPCVGRFRPTDVDFYAGGTQDTTLDICESIWQYTTSIEF